MIALISQREEENEFRNKINILEDSYSEYFEKLGFCLIPIPNNTENIKNYFNLNPDLMILSGGKDSKNRDKTENKLLDYAINKKIPVLGICKGMQFINTYFNGKITKVENHVAKNHKIKIGRKIEGVNSYHNLGFYERDLGGNLKIFAKSEDGVIEGIYHQNLQIMGIQWHPERASPDDEFNKNLIVNFLNKKYSLGEQ